MEHANSLKNLFGIILLELFSVSFVSIIYIIEIQNKLFNRAS